MNLKSLLILALAAISTIAATPKATAGNYGYATSCYTPYKVNTCELYRCTQSRYGYDNCGNRFCYNVTVVTYRDFYSDGSSQTYSRTFRA